MKFDYLISNKGELFSDLISIKPKIINDSRGFFFESWNKNIFNEIVNEDITFCQDNHSKSVKGTLRGLHYQKDPNAQGKLVRCLNGEVFDVAVDLRKSSKTFLNYTFVNLSGKNQTQFWIPRGFAHGFLTLTDYAEVFYKTTQYWNKDSELSLKWNDPNININWPIELLEEELNVSEKDKNAFLLSQLNSEHFFL